MKSWAHTYLAGAVSATALIAAAVVVFVPLVSLQALREWPPPGLTIGVGDGGGSGADEGGGVAPKARPTVKGSRAPSGRSSAVAGRTPSTAPGVSDGLGGQRHHGGAGTVRTGSLADGKKIAASTSLNAPVEPGPQPPAEAGFAPPPAPSTESGDLGGNSGSPVSVGAGEGDRAASTAEPAPASAGGIAPSPNPDQSAGSATPPAEVAPELTSPQEPPREEAELLAGGPGPVAVCTQSGLRCGPDGSA